MSLKLKTVKTDVPKIHPVRNFFTKAMVLAEVAIIALASGCNPVVRGVYKVGQTILDDEKTGQKIVLSEVRKNKWWGEALDVGVGNSVILSVRDKDGVRLRAVVLGEGEEDTVSIGSSKYAIENRWVLTDSTARLDGEKI